MEIGRVVTVPELLTTQWAAVTTMRLVHSAPLQPLVSLRMRTTAVLPSAEVPPTTAYVGWALITSGETAMHVAVTTRRHTPSGLRDRATRSGYESKVLRR